MLRSIELENFRSYAKIGVDVGSDLVLVLGDNASGKTNLLEAVYYLLTLSSFRSPDNLIVKSGEGHFRVSGNLSDSVEAVVVVQTSPAVRRKYLIDGKATNRNNWALPPAVLFVPADLNLFFLGPADRRVWINRILSQTEPGYRDDLSELSRILKQKTALLNAIADGQASGSELIVFNEQLAKVSVRITEARSNFLDYLQKSFKVRYEELTGLSREYRFVYRRVKEMGFDRLVDYLNGHAQAEIASRANLIGPHRDDVSLVSGEVLVVHNSSQGELRSQLLTLKLLETGYVEERTGRAPIILLDDVFSELDETRRTGLTEMLHGHQIFLTTTEEHHLPKNLAGGKVLTVEKGMVMEG